MVFFVVDKKIKEIGDVEQTSFWRLLELITRFKTYYEKRKRGKEVEKGVLVKSEKSQLRQRNNLVVIQEEIQVEAFVSSF